MSLGEQAAALSLPKRFAEQPDVCRPGRLDTQQAVGEGRVLAVQGTDLGWVSARPGSQIATHQAADLGAAAVGDEAARLSRFLVLQPVPQLEHAGRGGQVLGEPEDAQLV